MDHRHVRGRAFGDRVGRGPEFAAKVLGGPFDELHDGLELLRPGEDVHVGEAAFEVAGLEADHAAHDRDLEFGPFPLQVADAAELGIGAVFGMLAHGAGVDHDDVGAFGPVDLAHARCAEKPAASFSLSALFIWQPTVQR